MQTHVSQNLAPQLLARLKVRHCHGIVRDTLALTVNALQGVVKVGGGDGRLGDGDLHLILLGPEVELAVVAGLLAGLLVLLPGVLVLVLG